MSVRSRLKLNAPGAAKMYYPLGYRPALDGLRAMAIVPVILFHGGAPGFAWGYIGVDVFFVISGYLITAILLHEYTQTGWISLLAFYRRRALRLLPALAVLCLVFFCLSCAVLRNPKQAAAEVAAVVFYMANWTRAVGAGIPKALGHTWSLSVEEQFYMVWPLGILALLRIRPSNRLAIGAVLSLVLLVMFWRAYLTFRGGPVNRLYFGTDTRADEILIGAALALVLSIPRAALWLSTIARHLWFAAAVAVVAVPALLPWFDRRMFYAGYSMVAVAVAIIVTGALDDGLLARLLGRPALVWIGRRSYGLYLWHYPIMLLCLLEFHVPEGVVLTIIEGAGACALAGLSYRFIERPALQLRYRRLIPSNSAGGAVMQDRLAGWHAD